MSRITYLLAHTEEVHSTAAESIGHYFESPAFALAVWACLCCLLALFGHRILRLKTGHLVLAFSILQFLYGAYLYDKSAAIAAMIFSLGFGLCLFSVVSGLKSSEETAHTQKGHKDGQAK